MVGDHKTTAAAAATGAMINQFKFSIMTLNLPQQTEWQNKLHLPNCGATVCVASDVIGREHQTNAPNKILLARTCSNCFTIGNRNRSNRLHGPFKDSTGASRWWLKRGEEKDETHPTLPARVVWVNVLFFFQRLLCVSVSPPSTARNEQCKKRHKKHWQNLGNKQRKRMKLNFYHIWYTHTHTPSTNPERVSFSGR